MLKKRSKRKSLSFKTRELILKGILPKLPFEEILNDLLVTKEKNQFEMFGFLSIRHFRNGVCINDRGLVSCNLVTTAFANYLVDSLQNSTTAPMDVFHYHAVGTGTTAEANTQTTLVTEIESRVNGTKIEGASANIFKSVATVTFTGTHAVSEHAVFSASTAGTMLDRSLLSPADNVIATDQIEYTYQLTVSAE